MKRRKTLPQKWERLRKTKCNGRRSDRDKGREKGWKRDRSKEGMRRREAFLQESGRD